MKILNKIKHELVIQMFTFFYDDSSFLIMELMYGSFVQVIRERKLRKFSDVTLATILWPVVNAIAYLHSMNIVHQDLKPGNILLGFDGSIKICDFGVAAFVDPNTQYVVQGSRIGTVPYIAPEICKWKHYNSKADVWSIGIITLELGLLTMSKYNFHEKNIPNMIRDAMISGDQRYKPSYREFVESCLKTDPDDRAKSTDLLKASLMNLAQDQSHLMVELLGYKA